MTQAAIISLITFYSSINGVSPKVAVAVVEHESTFNVNAVGKLNEQGLFQLRPEFYSEYTIKQLRDPILNIQLGVKKLKEVKKTCVHQHDIEWLVCFNYGNTNAKKVKHPSLTSYVKNIKSIMRKK